MAFRYITVSCLDDQGRVNPMRWLRHKPAFIILNGDFHYTNMGTARDMLGQLWLPDVLSRPGEDPPPPANARTLQRMIDRYELWAGENGCPEWQQFWAAVRAGGIPVKARRDDHDFLGDNWCHDLVSLSGTFPDSHVGTYGNDYKEPFNGRYLAAAMLQTDTLHIWRLANQAWAWFKAKYTKNPASPGYNGDVPSAMVGVATPQDYPIDYWHEDYGPAGELGGRLHRVIYPDCLSYKSPFATAEGPLKQFFGVEQTKWLYATLLDAKAKGIPSIDLVLTKDVFGADNKDGLGNYTTVRAALLQFLEDNAIPGVHVSTGDKHLAHISIARKANGGITDLAVFCACPGGSRHSALDQHDELVWAAPRDDRHVYMLTTVDDVAGTVTKTIFDAFDDDTVLAEDVIPLGQRLPISSKRYAEEKPVVRGGYEPFTITVPASGTAWQNTTGRDVNAVITGGTVSAVAISRDGSTYDSGLPTSSQVYVANGEFLRITYTGVPTVRIYPRLTAAGI